MRTNQDEAEERRISVFEFGPGTLLLESRFRHRSRAGRPSKTAGSTYSGKSPEPLDRSPRALGRVAEGRSQREDGSLLRLIAASLPLPLFCARTFHTDWRFTSLGWRDDSVWPFKTYGILPQHTVELVEIAQVSLGVGDSVVGGAPGLNRFQVLAEPRQESLILEKAINQ